eukprot:3319937-Alexandrium_andersonii.AAC.1
MEILEPSPGPQPVDGRSHHEQSVLEGVSELHLLRFRESNSPGDQELLGPLCPRLNGVEEAGNEVKSLDREQP